MLYVILIILAVWIIIELLRVLGQVLLWVAGIGIGIAGLYWIIQLVFKHSAVALKVFLYAGTGALIVVISVFLLHAIRKRKEQVNLNETVNRYADWLDSVGIGAYQNSPGNSECWQIAIKKRLAIKIDDNYAISVPFSEYVVSAIHSEGLVRQTDFWRLGKAFSPEFQFELSPMLMVFLQNMGQIAILSPANMQKFGLAQEKISLLKQILLDEKTETILDLQDVCQGVEETAFVAKLDESILVSILSLLQSSTDQVIAAKAGHLLNTLQDNT